jgi:hypothetical protein
MPTLTLDYALPPPARRAWLRRLKALLWIAPVIALVAYTILHGPLTSADIRLDTGDLRYRYFGVPLAYRPMSEPERTVIQSLAAQSNLLRPEWVKCATYPLRTTNNTDLMCQTFYAGGAAWAKEDRQLAQHLLEDLATYVNKTHARKGLPDSCLLLSGFLVQWDNNGKRVVKSNWRNDPDVVRYLHSINYTPAPATRSSDPIPW